MKLSFLLAQREVLQEQARLSNMAYAHQRLACFAERIQRARLSGEVRLLQAEPLDERYQSTLTALEGSQAVLEEHFTERDLEDFVDAVGYATGDTVVDICFDLRELESRFLLPLQQRLVKRGVLLDQDETQDQHSQQQRHSG